MKKCLVNIKGKFFFSAGESMERTWSPDKLLMIIWIENNNNSLYTVFDRHLCSDFNFNFFILISIFKFCDPYLEHSHKIFWNKVFWKILISFKMRKDWHGPLTKQLTPFNDTHRKKITGTLQYTKVCKNKILAILIIVYITN